MAKINARGARQIGPTLFTERSLKDFKVVEAGTEGATLYHEAWRLRSDGKILTRIVWTESAEREEFQSYRYDYPEHPGRMRHSSAYALLPGATVAASARNIETLRHYLIRKGYIIVKEA